MKNQHFKYKTQKKKFHNIFFSFKIIEVKLMKKQSNHQNNLKKREKKKIKWKSSWLIKKQPIEKKNVTWK